MTYLVNLVKYKNMTEEVAAAEIDLVDDERRELIARLFHQDIDNPENYDLVINLGLMELEDMVRPTIAAIESKFALLNAEISK